GVAYTGDVGVGELVDQHDVGAAGEDRVGVHLGERRPPVGDRLPGHDLQSVHQRFGERPAVRLDVADDHVGAPLPAPVTFFEHRVGLADAGRGAEIHAERTLSHVTSSPQLWYGYIRSRARLSSRTLTAGSPMNPSARPSVYFAMSARTAPTSTPRA